jgi:hypothetical protein
MLCSDQSDCRTGNWFFHLVNGVNGLVIEVRPQRFILVTLAVLPEPLRTVRAMAEKR